MNFEVGDHFLSFGTDQVSDQLLGKFVVDPWMLRINRYYPVFVSKCRVSFKQDDQIMLIRIKGSPISQCISLSLRSCGQKLPMP